MDSDGDFGIAELPGFASLAPDMQALLRAAADGDDADRPRLLERVAEVVNVFIGLDLLQYVFMPSEDEDARVAGPVQIDLIAPNGNDSTSVAWFSVDEAGYDEYRDAVTLIGDIADLLNPPIVLDTDDEDERLAPDD